MTTSAHLVTPTSVDVRVLLVALIGGIGNLFGLLIQPRRG